MALMHPTNRPAPGLASRPASRSGAASTATGDETTCPHCGESRDLAKVKGCIKCLACGFKFDCNGW
jgi:uncharacterized protein (DUF983 family)